MAGEEIDTERAKHLAPHRGKVEGGDPAAAIGVFDPGTDKADFVIAVHDPHHLGQRAGQHLGIGVQQQHRIGAPAEPRQFVESNIVAGGKPAIHRTAQQPEAGIFALCLGKGAQALGQSIGIVAGRGIVDDEDLAFGKAGQFRDQGGKRIQNQGRGAVIDDNDDQAALGTFVHVGSSLDRLGNRMCKQAYQYCGAMCFHKHLTKWFCSFPCQSPRNIHRSVFDTHRYSDMGKRTRFLAPA